MVTFKDIVNFVSGNFNKMLDDFNLLDEKTKELALKRMDICKGCEYLKTKRKPHCGECGCPFPKLTYSVDKKCPKGKW